MVSFKNTLAFGALLSALAVNALPAPFQAPLRLRGREVHYRSEQASGKRPSALLRTTTRGLNAIAGFDNQPRDSVHEHIHEHIDEHSRHHHHHHSRDSVHEHIHEHIHDVSHHHHHRHSRHYDNVYYYKDGKYYVHSYDSRPLLELDVSVGDGTYHDHHKRGLLDPVADTLLPLGPLMGTVVPILRGLPILGGIMDVLGPMVAGATGPKLGSLILGGKTSPTTAAFVNDGSFTPTSFTSFAATGYEIQASNATQTPMFLVHRNTTYPGLACSNETIPVTLAIPIMGDSTLSVMCATYNSAPETASPLTASPCWNSTTGMRNNTSQVFAYTPKSGVVRPMWNIVPAINGSSSDCSATTSFAASPASTMNATVGDDSEPTADNQSVLLVFTTAAQGINMAVAADPSPSNTTGNTDDATSNNETVDGTFAPTDDTPVSNSTDSTGAYDNSDNLGGTFALSDDLTATNSVATVTGPEATSDSTDSAAASTIEPTAANSTSTADSATSGTFTLSDDPTITDSDAPSAGPESSGTATDPVAASTTTSTDTTDSAQPWSNSTDPASAFAATVPVPPSGESLMPAPLATTPPIPVSPPKPAGSSSDASSDSPDADAADEGDVNDTDDTATEDSTSNQGSAATTTSASS